MTKNEILEMLTLAGFYRFLALIVTNKINEITIAFHSSVGIFNLILQYLLFNFFKSLVGE
ncbi:hypothetical protein [Nostoc sp. UHCC 0252]|uniref:hypothetical protein n=1 Tax=Nostoc sp. UHCC 0252 TaxID=3110241 RepID=UPI002B21BE3C|nr:hypothetical protein [Nostoc sp. UHCC 0252]MEA5605587.1 hypothetical protein [Nostoc sp. UHCC 0252]